MLIMHHTVLHFSVLRPKNIPTTVAATEVMSRKSPIGFFGGCSVYGGSIINRFVFLTITVTNLIITIFSKA